MRHEARRYLPFSFLLICLLMIIMTPAAEGYSDQADWCERLNPCQMLGTAQAERILGQSARLSRQISELRGDARQCGCAYTGLSTNNTGGQESVLYFVVERREGNMSAGRAQQIMQSTKDDNAHDLSVVELQGTGDEAFLLSAESSSCLLMARKGGVIIRLQVKHSEKLSIEALKAFAREAIARL